MFTSLETILACGGGGGKPKPTTTPRPTCKYQTIGSCKCGVPQRSEHWSHEFPIVTALNGGESVAKNEFPWLVALVMKWKFQPFCTGTLISSKTVLMAAHCLIFKDFSKIRVLVGEHDLDNDDDGDKIYWPDTFTIHPDYKQHLPGRKIF